MMAPMKSATHAPQAPTVARPVTAPDAARSGRVEATDPALSLVAPPATPPKVPAADATLRVLAFLASQRGPVAAARIAAELELPRSTTYDLLAALVARGFALHLPEERQYALGPQAYAISAGYLRHAPLARVGRRSVERMVDAVGESGHLAVLNGRDVLYLVEERARLRPSLITDAGVRIPAHLTASGRAMLAALPAAQVRALYASPSDFSRRTDAPTPQTPGELRSALAEVRARGFAHERGEVTPGFSSVAVAVRDAAGWPIAAVALTWEDRARDAAGVAECEAAVRREAAAVAKALGGRVD